jgi:two-component system KDP operon response regulator KdpE
MRNSSNFVPDRAKGPRGMKYNTLLLVDDESQIRRVLQTTLAQAGYVVILAKNGQEGIDTVVREHPNLVLLDINLPDMSGFDACKMIRVSFAGPILMVSVRGSVRDKIDALNAGADDYIVKPFAMGELLARVQAALRRSSAEQPLPRIETSELTVDLEMRMVNVRGDRVHLTPKEFDVLRLLVIHQGKPVTHRKILQIVWGPEYGEETDLVRVVVKEIRKKIEKDPAHPRYIVTEPWIGYMFQLLPDMVEKRPPSKV